MPLIDGTVDEIYGPEELIGGEMGGGKWMRQGAFKAVAVPAPYGNGQWRLFNHAPSTGARARGCRRGSSLINRQFLCAIFREPVAGGGVLVRTLVPSSGIRWVCITAMGR